MKEWWKYERESRFLSKMQKGERLHPVVTLVIYYSEKEWDGPFSLKDMVVEMPEKIERIFSDYRMNLLQVRKSREKRSLKRFGRSKTKTR